MIDRFLLNFFGNSDNMMDWLDKLFMSKPKKKKNESIRKKYNSDRCWCRG